MVVFLVFIINRGFGFLYLGLVLLSSLFDDEIVAVIRNTFNHHCANVTNLVKLFFEVATMYTPFVLQLIVFGFDGRTNVGFDVSDFKNIVFAEFIDFFVYRSRFLFQFWSPKRIDAFYNSRDFFGKLIILKFKDVVYAIGVASVIA